MLGLPVGLQGPYVRPVELTLVPYEPLPSRKQAREDVLSEVKEGAFGDVLKYFRLKDVEAGVG